MAGHRWFGYFVWATLFGALIAWEGIGLIRAGDAYPTLSDAVRGLMRYPIGRWALFALWLWLGWHVFIRGWHVPLRGSASGAVICAYPPAARPRWIAFIQQLASTAIGGFLLLMLVLVGYEGVARPPGHFLASAATGTALLVAVAVPAFLAAAWLGERSRIRDHPRPGR